MFRKSCRTLIVVLAALLIASTAVLAAEGMMSGTVQKVDAQSGRLTVKSDEGRTMELQAPAALLEDLEAGDMVMVKMSGQKVTAIQKQDAGMPPGMSDSTAPQQPKGMPPARAPRTQQ